MDPQIIGLGAVAYLSGGIPTGYLIARKLRGIDIREHGSGNPGAANVYRVVGRWAGWWTLVIDALKGFLPVMLARHYYPNDYLALILVGALAIVGHVWTVYLRFRGGKGVATSTGVFLALLPKPTLLALLVFLGAVALSGHISVGSILASVTMPITAFWLGAPRPLVGMAAVVAALILVKHIPNMRRLMGKEELPFEDGSKKPAEHAKTGS
jgi:glycerol-3-phosphate acyltransferase PlsY